MSEIGASLAMRFVLALLLFDNDRAILPSGRVVLIEQIVQISNILDGQPDRFHSGQPLAWRIRDPLLKIPKCVVDLLSPDSLLFVVLGFLGAIRSVLVLVRGETSERRDEAHGRKLVRRRHRHVRRGELAKAVSVFEVGHS